MYVPVHCQIHSKCKYTYVYNTYIRSSSFVYILIFADTLILHNCDVTSPSIGNIIISCDSSHEILVTVLLDCNNVILTSNGYSPLTVRGLDPGVRYIIIINVFDGNRVVLSDERVAKIITVIHTTSSM